MSKVCSISIDMDPIGQYLGARGYEPREETNLNAIYEDALPRFLDLFDEFGVKATFFVVGKDLENADNRARIRQMHEKGHEVANHTYSHRLDFSQLPPEEKKTEIVKASDLIGDACGVRPIGFRAPGWGIDSQTLKILEDDGYQYDSSIFPSYLISVMAWSNWVLNRGRLKRTLGSTLNVGMAPKLPYYPSIDAPWRRGEMKIAELPVTVLPLMQLPFLGTVLFMWGSLPFRMSSAYLKKFDRPVLYELHGIELVDYYKEVNDPRLGVKPGLMRSIDDKVGLYRTMLETFSDHYEFKKMQEILTS